MVKKKNLLVVVDKPYVVTYIKDYFTLYSDIMTNYNIIYDYYSRVFDVRTGELGWYKHDDGWYMWGQLTDVESLELSDLDIPKDIYLNIKETDVNIFAKHFYNGDIVIDNVDSVLFIMHNEDEFNIDTCCILAARRYLDITNLSMNKCKIVSCFSLTVHDINNAFNHIYTFTDVYEKVKSDLIKSNFEIDVNRFERILCISRMNIKKFSEYFNIKRRTVENWKYGISKCPDYVMDLIEYKLLHEKII